MIGLCLTHPLLPWVSLNRTKWPPPLPWGATASTTPPLSAVAVPLSAAPCPLLGTSNLAGTFAAGICDLVTFVISVNASGIESATFWRSIILFTSLSLYEVRGSRWDRVGTNHDNSCRSLGKSFFLSPPNDGKTVSSKWQSANLAVERSPVKGSK